MRPGFRTEQNRKFPGPHLVPDIVYYDTLYSLSTFSLAKSLLLILEISAAYRLVSYLLADIWLICRLLAKCMITNNRLCQFRFLATVCFSLFSSEQCIMKQNRGLGKSYQPRPSARLITLTSTLIIQFRFSLESDRTLQPALRVHLLLG